MCSYNFSQPIEMFDLLESPSAEIRKNIWEAQLNHYIEEHTIDGNIYNKICYCNTDERNVMRTPLEDLDKIVDMEDNQYLTKEIEDLVKDADIFGALSASFIHFDSLYVLRVKFGFMPEEQLVRYIDIL